MSEPINADQETSVNASFDINSLDSAKCVAPIAFSATPFVLQSPILLLSKSSSSQAGGKAGRPSNVDRLNKIPVQSNRLDNYWSCDSAKRQRSPESTNQLNCPSTPPAKRSALFTSSPIVNQRSDDSELLNNSSPTLSPTNQTVMAGPATADDVNEIYNKLSTQLTSFQQSVNQQLAEQAKSHTNAIGVLKEEIVELNAKCGRYERRLAEIEKRLPPVHLGSSGQPINTSVSSQQHSNPFSDPLGSVQGPSNPFQFQEEILQIKRFILRQDRDNRKCNAVLKGLPHSETSPKETANGILSRYFNLTDAVADARMLNTQRGEILLRLHDFDIKKQIMSAKRDALQGTKIFIDNDLSEADGAAAKLIRDIRRRCVSRGIPVKQGYNRVAINGVEHSYSCLTNTFTPPIPEHLWASSPLPFGSRTIWSSNHRENTRRPTAFSRASDGGAPHIRQADNERTGLHPQAMETEPSISSTSVTSDPKALSTEWAALNADSTLSQNTGPPGTNYVDVEPNGTKNAI